MKDKIYSIEDLSKYRLEKAKDDLDASKINFENKKFSQSINRSYYTIFHATRSLLAFNIFDSKKHSGIISFFRENYIKNNKIEKKYSDIIGNAQRIRLESDYKDFYVISKDQAKKQIDNAEDFIERIEKYIKENYAKK